MQKYSWEQTEPIFNQLAKKIKASGFVPDYIIGIASGGLIPLYFLAKRLDDINNILTVTADSYECPKPQLDRKKNLRILYLPEIDLSGKKLLLVDDIAESGDTLKFMLQAIIDKYRPQIVKTATLGINTEKCTFRPDFWIIEEKGDWVVFPWEDDDNWPEYK
ncbi:MAG: hypothetical protein A3A33_01220 [Candidatus Yanofskybacteria bacterium RIFCSPLOWO2_01_FULL_49_25]|uniref:Phosphoribosyltransferase domain-containing protein n=1 Tax=Candidatus Yanofskybacteria bacterium RIFCSPLOWO2_01_FULL_49_25 TaxID=1802701 RepID=A0A1F8GZ73_9BACT|nr:MAG: hypothetical protein A3A33_01220 [Candidatus Yanofskybacteria bacterium RIFCSPLOWO2_01_FULL_49_25]